MLAVAILAALVAASYSPSMQAGFVWDDAAFVGEPAVRDASGIGRIWFSPGVLRSEGHYWPIVYSSFWLEHKLWGYSPAGFHRVNILLHLINCILIWRLMLLLEVPGAWWIAAVFAVHPLRVESVAWIIERKDLLCTLFSLVTALIWVRANGRPSKREHALATVAYAAAMLSKSMAVTLPAALILWRWWKRGRVTGADCLRVIPLATLAAAITLADLAFYQGREPLSLGYDFIERMQIAAGALLWYAGKILWPTNLVVIYPHWNVGIGELSAWAPVAGCAAMAGILWWSRRRVGWGPSVGAAFFALTLSPVLGFIDYGYMQFSFVADRYQYLAGLGVISVLVSGAFSASAKLQGRMRNAAKVAAVMILAILSGVTWRHAARYENGVTLFRHIVSKNPTARSAHVNLASALLDQRRDEEALEAALTAIGQRRPGLATMAHISAATALLRLGRPDEARGHASQAMEQEPRNAGALATHAKILARQGDHAAALQAYEDALEIDSRSAAIQTGLAEALFELQRYEECIETSRQALTELAAARGGGAQHLLIGRSWQRLGRMDRAEQSMLQALDLMPQHQDPLLALSGLRHEQGRPGDAEDYLSRAKQLSEGKEPSLRYAADALRKQKRYEEAIALFREALEADPESASSHAGLGHSLFDSGRYQEAVASMQRSISLDPDTWVVGTLHSLIAQAFEQLGRPADAETHYLAAIERKPQEAHWVDRLALLLYQQKRYHDAERWYERMVELMPGSAQAFANLAATRHFVGKPEEAIQAFRHALTLDPDSRAAQSGLANILAATGRQE